MTRLQRVLDVGDNCKRIWVAEKGQADTVLDRRRPATFLLRRAVVLGEAQMGLPSREALAVIKKEMTRTRPCACPSAPELQRRAPRP